MDFLTHNYHTHTFRCGHASGTDREYVEAAIRGGLRVLGFSDHTPMPFANGFYSGHRVQPDMAQDYFDSLTALKEEFKDRIEIHIGAETEYYPESFEGYLQYMEQFPVEYFILGQHFLWREEDGIGVFRATDDASILKQYYQNVIQAVDTGKFLYVAHPDVLKFTGDDLTFERWTRPFLEEMKEKDVVLGFNRYGFFENRNYPRPLFWRIAAELGCRTLIELDAHSPDVLEDTDTMQKCIAALNQYGIEPVQSLTIG